MSSSSELVSSMRLLRLNDYVSLALITAVVYDYFLTFSREVNYVWCKPWTGVSTMFVLVRYVGLFWTMINGLFGSTFVPGPQRVDVRTQVQIKNRANYNFIVGHSEGTILLVALTWAYQVFLIVADGIMVLRVHAMWNRSRPIRFILLLIYPSAVVISSVLIGIYDDPHTHLSVTVTQTFGYSSCGYSYSDVPSLLTLYRYLPRFILGVALLVLVVAQTLKQSIEMYRATKQWQPNRYVQLLVRDGVLYFLVNMLFNVVALLQSGKNLNSIMMLFLILFSNTAICIALPRFIIDVRELYDDVSRSRWQPQMDSGLGSSQFSISRHITSLSAIGSTDGSFGQVQTTAEVTNEDELDGHQLESLRGDMDTHLV